CASPVIYPPVPAPLPTSTPPTPTSTPHSFGAPEFYFLTVTVTGLSGSDRATIMTTDATNLTKTNRVMGNWSAVFLMPTGNQFTTTATAPGYTATMSSGCNGV